MPEQPQVILSAFADEAANQKTAVQQFAALAAIGLQYYSLRFIDAGGESVCHPTRKVSDRHSTHERWPPTNR